MKFVAYYRVSTQKQGKSGLGLEAQKAMVQTFAKTGQVIAEYTDIESGKRNDRPELAKAIAQAKALGAKLLIAKLDRLSRNAAFIFTLKESGIDFTCADMPEANTLTIGIFATLAQYERELISDRTKKALEAKKAQGFKLGKDNLTESGRVKSIQTRKAKALANENNQRATELILAYQGKGYSLSIIAEKLNASGFKTSTGKAFGKSSVKMLLDRCKTQSSQITANA